MQPLPKLHFDAFLVLVLASVGCFEALVGLHLQSLQTVIGFVEHLLELMLGMPCGVSFVVCYCCC